MAKKRIVLRNTNEDGYRSLLCQIPANGYLILDAKAPATKEVLQSLSDVAGIEQLADEETDYEYFHIVPCGSYDATKLEKVGVAVLRGELEVEPDAGDSTGEEETPSDEDGAPKEEETPADTGTTPEPPKEVEVPATKRTSFIRPKPVADKAKKDKKKSKSKKGIKGK